MKERHWNSLIASLRHGQCVLLLGPEIPVQCSGAQQQAQNGSLVAALKGVLARELEEDDRRVSGTTLGAVAQQYEDTEGFRSGALRAAAERFYKSGAFSPSSVHATLAALPFTLVVTTCQDDLLVQALEKAGKKAIRQRYHFRGDKRDNPEFVLPGSPGTPVVFHLFGDAGEPQSLVLSENDLLDFLIAVVSERPPLPNSLLRALKRGGQSYLFVGFGIAQWHLRVLLKVLIRALEMEGDAIAAEPLRALVQADREETILFCQRGTRVEMVDCDVDAFLAEVVKRLEAEGGFVGEAVPFGPHPRVFISYAREDGDVAARIYDALQKAHFEPWLDQESLHGGDLWEQHIEDELRSTDFVLVLWTPAFSRKTDSFVNQEVALAKHRGLSVRGSFLIPLRCDGVGDADRVAELAPYDEMPLRLSCFEEDMAKVISTMLREYQRRNR